MRTCAHLICWLVWGISCMVVYVPYVCMNICTYVSIVCHTWYFHELFWSWCLRSLEFTISDKTGFTNRVEITQNSNFIVDIEVNELKCVLLIVDVFKHEFEMPRGCIHYVLAYGPHCDADSWTIHNGLFAYQLLLSLLKVHSISYMIKLNFCWFWRALLIT